MNRIVHILFRTVRTVGAGGTAHNNLEHTDAIFKLFNVRVVIIKFPPLFTVALRAAVGMHWRTLH